MALRIGDLIIMLCCIQVVIERARRSQLPDLAKFKYLFHATFTGPLLLFTYMYTHHTVYCAAMCQHYLTQQCKQFEVKFLIQVFPDVLHPCLQVLTIFCFELMPLILRIKEFRKLCYKDVFGNYIGQLII